MAVDTVTPVAGMYTLVEHRGRMGLDRLEADWRSLYAGMPDRRRYHAFEAHKAYVNHLSLAPGRQRYLALMDGDDVRAICPIEPALDCCVYLPVPAWALPSHPHWLATDVIAPDDEARRALLPAVALHLRKTAEHRPLLLLGPTPEDSALWDGLHAIGRRHCCPHSTTPSNYFDCEQPYDVLMSRLSKHFRRNLRSHSNKLLAMGDVRFVNVLGKEALEAELETFMAIEASGWKGASGTGSAIKLHPRLVAFYLDLISSMTGPEDRCEINSLYAEGRCIAAQFCVRTGEEYTILKIAYDETYSRLGPGQVLFLNTLERCCGDPGIKRIDLVSDASWFRDWRTERASMRQAHVAIGRLSRRPLISLLGLRYGIGRAIAYRIRTGTDRPRASRPGRGAVDPRSPSTES